MGLGHACADPHCPARASSIRGAADCRARTISGPHRLRKQAGTAFSIRRRQPMSRRRRRRPGDGPDAGVPGSTGKTPRGPATNMNDNGVVGAGQSQHCELTGAEPALFVSWLAIALSPCPASVAYVGFCVLRLVATDVNRCRGQVRIVRRLPPAATRLGFVAADGNRRTPSGSQRRESVDGSLHRRATAAALLRLGFRFPFRRLTGAATR